MCTVFTALTTSAYCIIILIVNFHEIERINMDFIKHTDRYSYESRNKEDFVLPNPRTNQLTRSFKYSAISTWNLLPLDIRKSTSLNTLKRFLKNVNF